MFSFVLAGLLLAATAGAEFEASPPHATRPTGLRRLIAASASPPASNNSMGEKPIRWSLNVRVAHSIKGGAATFGFADVAELTHQMESLLDKLRRHELVESTRGPGGGYTLARKAGDITVADIIVSVDEPIDATQCGG